MREPIYRQALSHSWKLVWHNKILWIFGLLAALVGQFGINNFVGKLAVAISTNISLSDYFLGTYWKVQGWGTLLLAWLAVIAAAVCIITILAAVAAQGAIIAAALDWYKKKKTDSLKKAWHRGTKHFWKLFFLNVIKRAVFFLVILAVVSLIRNTGASNMTYSLIFFILGTFIALIVSTVTIYAAGYVVEDESGLIEAIIKGWNLFAGHMLVSLELSLIFFVFDVILVAVTLALSTLVLIPTFVLSLVAGFTGLTGLITVGIFISLIIFILFIVLIGSVYNAFTISAWTYMFMKMHREGVRSRVLHFLGLSRD